MGRASLTLISEADRQKAIHWITKAPPRTRVEFKAHRRSTDQNSKMWAMLTEVAEQATHMGQRYSPDQWKILFMYACGREVQFLPGLDGKTFLPWGQSTSDLSKEEMTDLIEFIYAWGAENGVTFRDDDEHQSETDSSQDVSEQGGGEGSPPASPPSDNTEADGNQAEGEASEVEGDSSPSPNSLSPSALIECCRKLLAISVDETCTPLERRQVLVKAKDAWKEKLPDHHDEIRAFFQSADSIIKDEASFDGAVSHFAGKLGVTEGELKESRR